MKKLLYPFFSLMLVASVMLTTSCGTDDDELTTSRPSFTITGIDDVTGTTVDVGEPVSFTVNVNAPGGFNAIRIYRTVGEDGPREMIDEVNRTPGQVVQTQNYSFSYTPTAAEAGQNVYIEFEAVDDEGRDNIYEYVITVNEQELLSYDQVLLFAPLDNQTSETWFSTSTGETYTSSEVNATQEQISSEIDFGYFYGQTRQASLASVASYPTTINAGSTGWTAQNDTQLRKTNLEASAFFETTSAATIEQAFNNAEAGANPGQATNLEVGDVIAFMTDAEKPGGSKMGLIHVADIVTGTGASGSIRINVIVMP